MPSKAHPVFDALKANTLRLIIRELGQVSMVKGKREDMIARLVEIERTGCTWRVFVWTIRAGLTVLLVCSVGRLGRGGGG